MAVEEVVLTGDATRGIGPSVRGLAELPQQVKLGCRRPPARPPAPRFAAYFDRKKAKAAPPRAINRRDKAADSLARMYLNDQMGCCVISGKAHALGLWSGADLHPAGVVLASDQEIYEQYQRICGRGDNGCYISAVLDVMRDRGFVAGGRSYRIDGYVSCDWRNKLQVQTVQYLFGATTIGFDLPQAWTSSAVWDVTNSRTVGGHDVTPIDYDEKGVYVSSWGRIYLMTWAAFTSKRWISEYYVMLAPLWYGDDRLAPSGVDVEQLKSDLAKIGGGLVPPLPEPKPPPTPPTPAGQIVAVVGLDRDGKEVARWE